MTLTPRAVQLGPTSDPELVIVVCEDADGNTHNEYVRDARLRKSLSDATTVCEHRDAEVPILSRATAQIDLRANPPATEL